VKVGEFDVSKWRAAYREAEVKIVEGKIAISRCLSEAEELASRGKVDLSNKVVWKELWDGLGGFLYIEQLFPDCEKLNKDFVRLLDRHDPNRSIPRAPILYRLGIVQLNQGNYDEGILNILNALDEDERLYGREKASRKVAAQTRDYLRASTASMIDREYTSELRARVKLDNRKKTSTEDILNSLPTGAQLFLSRSVNVVHSVPFQADIYSRVLMFDNLKTLCLLLENSLKTRGRGLTLGYLIHSVFEGELWEKCFWDNMDLTSFRVPTVPPTSGTLREFESQLMRIEARDYVRSSQSISGQDAFLVHAFLKSTLLRNMTAHLFDTNASILRDVSTYKDAFRAVMLSLLYSLHYQSQKSLS